MRRFWLLLLAAGSAAAAEPGRVPRPEPTFVLPQIQLPLPKLSVVPVFLSRLGLQPASVGRLEVHRGHQCGGVSEMSDADFAAHGMIDLFGSVQNFRTVLAAASVEIVPLQPAADPCTTAVEIAGNAITLSEHDAAVVRAVFTCDAAYLWQGAPFASARDGYRLKFRSSGNVVMLDLFLTTRCVVAPSLSRVPPTVRLDFGYPSIAPIINRHFPGAAD